MIPLPREQLNTVGVFCGSASGTSKAYTDAATTAGKGFAEAGLTIVYGGGSVGLMGAAADGSLNAGGTVIGVMPQSLIDREIAHTGLSDLIVVGDMHQRKTKMADLSDAFLVLPGGAGTLEEFFEQWTWAQLAYHKKPIALLNIEGFFDPLLSMIDHIIQSGFLKQAYRDMLVVHDNLEDVLHGFRTYQPPSQKTY